MKKTIKCEMEEKTIKLIQLRLFPPKTIRW